MLWLHPDWLLLTWITISIWLLSRCEALDHWQQPYPHHGSSTRRTNLFSSSRLSFGNVTAVYELVDRVLSSQTNPLPIRLSIFENPDENEKVCGSHNVSCFQLQDLYPEQQGSTNNDSLRNNHSNHTNDSNKNDPSWVLHVSGTSASELGAGIGWYLRHYCNMTLGWPRGGGSFLPPMSRWPRIDANKTKRSLVKRRQVPWSYLMNVCTHSYSLVWYNETDWENYIDWLSLSGINLILALTGQEEIQHRVFTQLGLNDHDISTWFNGPAFLTWSRGQNEYGNNICGPLPKSFRQQQFDLQKFFILPRLRSLGIVGQLPGFQGNVPIQLQALFPKSNMTQQGDTGWLDALDPLYGRIADLYMKILLREFGTDHWYQLDGYFNGGTAPWVASKQQTSKTTPQFTEDSSGKSDFPHDNDWYQRGRAVYTGLTRSDPDAIWAFQGFSFIDWSSQEQGQALKGFVDAAPPGKFVVMDMSYTGGGEWQKWNNASFFGAPFVWTALHNFGGTDGLKGDMFRLNQIPHSILSPISTVVGVGATPEGIDQNTAFYEFLFDSAFREHPTPNLHSYVADRSDKRYGLAKLANDANTHAIRNHLNTAWSLLLDSVYSNDFTTFDKTGISHLTHEALGEGLFEADRFTPKPIMCQVFEAWRHFILAVQLIESSSKPTIQAFRNNEPFIYDLINLGREVLAQISTPAALNFSDATERNMLNRFELEKTGGIYMSILLDVDSLVATDTAFLLGPWLESARELGKDMNACNSTFLPTSECQHFFEWNARTQLTTWNPTPANASAIPEGPIDYASKHWSGLILDYYVVRASILLQQSLRDEDVGQSLDHRALDERLAQHAFQWTTGTNSYSSNTIGDPFEASQAAYAKNKHWFAACQHVNTTSQ